MRRGKKCIIKNGSNDLTCLELQTPEDLISCKVSFVFASVWVGTLRLACLCLDGAAQPPDVLRREAPWSVSQPHQSPGLLIWVSREPAPPRQPRTSGGNGGFAKKCVFVPGLLWLAALPFPRKRNLSLSGKEQGYLLERLGLKESTNMPCTSFLPAFQELAHLMETGAVPEHSSPLENTEAWDIRAGRDIKGWPIHPPPHSHFTDE